MRKSKYKGGIFFYVEHSMCLHNLRFIMARAICNGCGPLRSQRKKRHPFDYFDLQN